MQSVKRKLCASISLMDNVLILSISGDMDDDNISEITKDFLAKAHELDVRGAILDFSSVMIIDSYMFDKFTELSGALRLIGSEPVWVGLRPTAVASIIDKDIFLLEGSIKTSANLENGLKLIKSI